MNRTSIIKISRTSRHFEIMAYSQNSVSRMVIGTHVHIKGLEDQSMHKYYDIIVSRIQESSKAYGWMCPRPQDLPLMFYHNECPHDSVLSVESIIRHHTNLGICVPGGENGAPFIEIDCSVHDHIMSESVKGLIVENLPMKDLSMDDPTARDDSPMDDSSVKSGTFTCAGCRRPGCDNAYAVVRDGANNKLCVSCYFKCVSAFANANGVVFPGLNHNTGITFDYHEKLLVDDFNGGWCELPGIPKPGIPKNHV